PPHGGGFLVPNSAPYRPVRGAVWLELGEERQRGAQRVRDGGAGGKSQAAAGTVDVVFVVIADERANRVAHNAVGLQVLAQANRLDDEVALVGQRGAADGIVDGVLQGLVDGVVSLTGEQQVSIVIEHDHVRHDDGVEVGVGPRSQLLAARLADGGVVGLGGLDDFVGGLHEVGVLGGDNHVDVGHNFLSRGPG